MIIESPAAGLKAALDALNGSQAVIPTGLAYLYADLERSAREAVAWMETENARSNTAAIRGFHSPKIAEHVDGWGAFCSACSYDAGNFVFPCRLEHHLSKFPVQQVLHV